MSNVKKGHKEAIKEITKTLTFPEYFQDKDPRIFSAKGYFEEASRKEEPLTESVVKRLQNEWRNKLIPALKGSQVEHLQRTGSRLEKSWKVDKTSMQLPKGDRVSKRRPHEADVLSTVKKDSKEAIEEITKTLTFPEYFQDKDPRTFNAKSYFQEVSRKEGPLTESAVKRLHNEWRNKLIPALKGSQVDQLQRTGSRLEKSWKVDKTSMQLPTGDRVSKRRPHEADKAEERIVKRHKAELKRIFQDHRLALLEASSKRLKKDLLEMCKFFLGTRCVQKKKWQMWTYNIDI